jgi:PKD repeat protein
MKKSNLIILMAAFIAAVNFSSCKKDSAEPQPFVFYSVSVDGATVTFTNKSEGTTSYKWDFGDGTTSTDESPVHTYPGKGKYVPTLYATTADGVTVKRQQCCISQKLRELNSMTIPFQTGIQLHTMSSSPDLTQAILSRPSLIMTAIMCTYILNNTLKKQMAISMTFI